MNRDSNRSIGIQRTEILTIERIGWGGIGIARAQSGKVIVLHASLALFPGEIVEARVEWKRQHGEGYVVRWIERSEKRSISDCLFAAKCGGCTLWESGDQSGELKKMMVVDLLNREFKRSEQIEDSVIEYLQWLPAPPNTKRNRIQLHYENGALGYFEKGSYRIVKIDRCVAADETLNEAITIVRSNIKQLVNKPHENSDKRKYRSGDTIRGQRARPTRIELSTGVPPEIVYITTDSKPDLLWRINFTCSDSDNLSPNVNSSAQNSSTAPSKSMQLLKPNESKESFLTYTFNGTAIRNHPSGFFQVCPEWSWEAFGRLFTEWQVAGDRLYDLYGGCGFFSVLLRKRFKSFTIVESDKKAAEFARSNLMAYESDTICDDISNWLKTATGGQKVVTQALEISSKPTGLRRLTRGATYPPNAT